MKRIIIYSLLLLFVYNAQGQTTIWSEDFSSYQDPTGIRGSGTVNVGDYPNNVSKWSLDVSNCSLTATSDWFYVTNNEFSGRDLDGEAVWTSESISISGYSNVSLSVDISESGTLESSDYIKVYYKLDGGTETLFSTNGSKVDDFGSATATQSGLSGNNVVIIIKCINNAGSEYYKFDNISVTGTASSQYDNESIIEKKSGWSEPTNIAYATYSASSGLTSSNSLEVAKFTIKDGGSDGTDSDSKSTKLTDISFTVDKYQNIAALAIFDGTNNVAEVTSVSGTTSFSSLTLEAADEGTKDFSLRATFKSSVTDNDNLKFTVSSATADNTGSTFAASDAGGAATDNTGNNNKIVVTADRLAFTSNKPPSSVTKSENFNVEVEATDANGNRDLDASNSVTLSKASGNGTLSSATGLTQSLSSGVYLWSDVQYNTVESFTISASASGLTSATSGSINCMEALSAWINEFHYDNDGTDQGEFVEICIKNANDYTLSDFTVTLYNGANGSSYDTKTVNNFTVGNTYDSVHVFYYDYPANGIQNGPDGICLSYDDGSKAIQVLEFISYEGSFTATDGPANGTSSSNLSVSESGSTAVGTSIGRVGTNDENTWEAGNTASKGSENNKSGGGTQILPVELLSFKANNKGNYIYLTWETATESNNRFFTLERSENGSEFTEVAKIKGAGNSNKPVYYSYTDNAATGKSTLYYRLKQTDFDGHFSYSKIIEIDRKDIMTLKKVYGSGQRLTIEMNNPSNTILHIDVIAVDGRIVESVRQKTFKGQKRYNILLNNKLEGIYIIRISYGNEVFMGKYNF